MHNAPLKEEELQTLYIKEILLQGYRKRTGVNDRKAN